ncbi:18.1 kDa class I heat shock protein-like [Silene latifolia]|uniref:18.1 kDa class I heat shock protein-like n=1 Tax=Silene latifolia TaxID=37657 RepID=UPI003D76DD95
MAQPRPFMPQMMIPQMNFPQMPAPVARTKIEYKETPEAHHFMAELPGLRKEDVDVHVEDGKLLHISAKKKHNREENSENYYYVERGGGEFVTRFMLPPNAKANHMSTCVDNGVLTVTVPKEKIDMSNQCQHDMSNQRHQY